jgi:ABC-2 type transport system ATP-binding protein
MFHPGTENMPPASPHGDWQQKPRQPFPSQQPLPGQQPFAPQQPPLSPLPPQQLFPTQQPLPLSQQPLPPQQQAAFPVQQQFSAQAQVQPSPFSPQTQSMSFAQSQQSPFAGFAQFPQVGQGPAGEIILQTVGLTKAYGQRLAVNSLNLTVERGEIFGFLGSNGAGKTTTIRMLLNLIKPTSGEVRLFGESLSKDPQRLLPRVGALIEQPAFQSYMSGRDNLIAVGGYTGGIDLKRVDEVLEIVGLGERGKDRYSTYSLGMKQRLGVGAALLTDPELIILDEPGNGLDPAGIVEMRELIRKLAQLGKTVFVSSHILAEIRQFCTRIGIIRSGQLIATGSVDELLRSSSRWEVEVANPASPEQVASMLAKIPIMRSVAVEQGVVVINAPDLRGRDLIYFLAKNGIWPETVKRSEEDLEHIFLRLTDKEAGL